MMYIVLRFVLLALFVFAALFIGHWTNLLPNLTGLQVLYIALLFVAVEFLMRWFGNAYDKYKGR